MIQVFLQYSPSQSSANEFLRRFQVEHPTANILSVNLIPHEPMGYFMTITYNIERS